MATAASSTDSLEVRSASRDAIARSSDLPEAAVTRASDSSSLAPSAAPNTPVKITARPTTPSVTSSTPDPVPVASTSSLASTIDHSQSAPTVASPPKDKKITLLRRSSSTGSSQPPPSGAGTSETSPDVGAAMRPPRSASEGRGQASGRTAGESTYRRLGSESALASRDIISAEDRSSDGAITPRSSTSSPVPSTSATGSSAGGIPSDKLATGDAAPADEGSVPPPPELDSVLLLALAHPRDRILLLRAEGEIERFLASPTLHRLPLCPPYFPPALNSYQRLLIHRLADTFGITREVDPIPPQPAWVGATPQLNTGVVVLVKGESARLPPRKLASYVPAPPSASTSISANPPPPPSSPAAPTILPTATPTSVAITTSALPSPTASPSPSASPVIATAAPTQPQIFKILPRASAHRPSSSASSSVGTDDDGGKNGGSAKGRRELTLEEREAAYKEARERIWAQQPEEKRDISADLGITRPSSAGSSYSRSSAALSASGARASPSEASSHSASNMSMHSNFQGPTVYYPPSSASSANGRMAGSGGQAQHGGPVLRPSAPSFDPSGAGGSTGWTSYGYAGQGEYEQGYAPYADYAQSGDEWSRRQAGRPTASTSAYSYAQQPPIQVTAPPPPNQPPYPAPSALQYPPLIRPTESYTSPPPHSALPTAWSNRGAPALPSPALSTSSGGSSYAHLHHSQQQPHPPLSHRSSSNGSVASTSGSTGGANYLMRFPDGGIVGFNPSPASSVSGSASAAYAASSTSSTGYSAAGSTRSLSTGSASTSRTASSSNLRGPASSVGAGTGAAGEGAAPTARRSSYSTSHSISSSSVASGSAAVSEAGSSGGKRASSDKRSASGSERGGASSSKGKGREDDAAAADGQAAIKKSTVPLHPSLPAKPAWVTKQPPVERTIPYVPGSAAALADATSPETTRRPPSLPSSIPSSSYGLPGTVQSPPVIPAPYSTSSADFNSQATSPSPQYAPPGYYQAPPLPPGQAWPVGDDGFYGGRPPPLGGPHQHLQGSLQQYPNLLMHENGAQWPSSSIPMQDPIMQAPEIRRPPPRSTALFDYSKTSSAAAVSAGKRNGSAGRGSAAAREGIAEVDRAIEGMRL